MKTDVVKMRQPEARRRSQGLADALHLLSSPLTVRTHVFGLEPRVSPPTSGGLPSGLARCLSAARRLPGRCPAVTFSAKRVSFDLPGSSDDSAPASVAKVEAIPPTTAAAIRGRAYRWPC